MEENVKKEEKEERRNYTLMDLIQKLLKKANDRKKQILYDEFLSG
jgi:hypothetical protein